MNIPISSRKRFFMYLSVLLFALCLLIPQAHSVHAATGNVESYVGQTDHVSHVNTGSAVIGSYRWTNSNSSVIKITGSTGQECYYYAKKTGSAVLTLDVVYYTKQWNPITGNLDVYTTPMTIRWNVKVVKPTERINLGSSTLSINKGNASYISYSVYPSGASQSLSWSSSNKNIASVDKNGKVTAKSTGTVTITAKAANGVRATKKVKVVSPCTKLKLNYSKLSLGKGDTYTLTSTVTPSDCTDSVKWSTSDKKIATVSSSGKITAKKTGTVTITAKYGSKKYKCTVTVKSKQITKIKPKKSTVNVVRGKSYTLGYTLSPSSAGGTLKWWSSNEKIATVDKNGKVKALKTGKATITAKASSGVKTKYTVNVILPATGIKLAYKELPLGIGKSYTLKATVTPSDTTDKITWKSGNSKIVKVSSSGKLTGVKAGTTWVQATAGDYKAKCTITVVDEVPCTSISIKDNDPAVIRGEYLKLKCKLGGAPTVTDGSSNITWRSSNPSIATVDANGKVYGVKEGPVTITASLRGMSAEYPLIVTKGVWADLSVGSGIDISSDYYVHTDVPYKKVPYDSSTGLTIVQSDPAKTTNRIKFTTTEPHITLANVNTASIQGSKVYIELMEGTENYIKGRIRGSKYLTIKGKGTLHVYSTDDNCLISNETIYIQDGKIYLNRTNTNYYAIYSESSVTINSAATVYVHGSKPYTCRKYYDSIATGSLITRSSGGNTALKKITVEASSTAITPGEYADVFCTAYYGHTETRSISASYAGWSSSNPSVADVNVHGTIIAKSPGKATITATYGGQKASIVIQVIKAADVSKGEICIYDGYYTIGSSDEKIPFNAKEGIKFVQSGTGFGDIWFMDPVSYDHLKICLSGIKANLSGYVDNNLIIELESGSLNTLKGMIYGSGDLTIQGEGSLTVIGTTVPIDVRGSIYIKNATVTADCPVTYWYTAICYRKDLVIADDAHLTMKLATTHEPALSDIEKQYIANGRMTLIQNR